MPSNQNNTYKVVVIALSVFLLIVLFKSYKDNKSAIELQGSLKQESLITQNQLSEVIEKYDSISMIYNNFDDSFSSLTSKVNNVRGNKNKLTFKNLAELNEQIDQIKDSINLLQEKLKQIEKIKDLVKPDVNSPKIESKNIYKNSNFEIINLQAKGVKFLNDNTSPNSVKTIEQIRVCFTIDKNSTISFGEKEFFVQVVNPKNDIVSVNKLAYEKNSSVLRYSKLAKFNYNQQITDVCSYVDLEKNKTIKGRYIVNLYFGLTKISSTIFNYN